MRSGSPRRGAALYDGRRALRAWVGGSERECLKFYAPSGAVGLRTQSCRASPVSILPLSERRVQHGVRFIHS